MTRHNWLLLLVALTVTGGCAGQPAPTPRPAPPQAPTAAPTATPTSVAPTAEATPVAVPADVEPAVTAARRDLASRLGVDLTNIDIKSSEAVEWPDSSLGCPEPGKMYLQVITPGYRVVLEVAGQAYEYHTNRGNRAVLCPAQGQAARPTGAARLHELRDLVERARDDLAQRLGIEPARILVAEALPVAGLAEPAACPEAHALSDAGTAYQLVLRAEGRDYVYRAAGEAVVLCAQ